VAAREMVAAGVIVQPSQQPVSVTDG
jgi:hypothetical protein